MKRTDQQRKAIEVYCREVANALNDAGFDLKAVIEAKPIPVSCTQENIKEIIFKAIMKALYNKTSTAELEKIEVNDVYMHMHKWLAEQFGINIEFPKEGE